MYRKIEDFIQDWNESAAGTLAVFRAMTDDKLNQAIAEEHNTLGWLAWHLTNAPVFLTKFVGVNLAPVGNPAEVPASAKTIADSYQGMSSALAEAVRTLSDADLAEEVDAFGGKMARGQILRKIVDHQTHHRGQMTVLLRQAGLPVPGVMGPTKEQK